MFQDGDDRVHGDCDENGYQDNSQFVHSKFTFIKLRWVELQELPNVHLTSVFQSDAGAAKNVRLK